MEDLVACFGECGRRRQLPKGWCCEECKKKISEAKGGDLRHRGRGFWG